MSQSQAPSRLLPSEPLLEIRSRDLARCRPRPEVRRWLRDLEGEGDLVQRSQLLANSLRKRLGSDQLKDMLAGLASLAADGESDGISGLAAMLAVRAQGSSIVEGIFEFRHLHRVGTRYRHRLGLGHELEPEEKALLAEVDAVESELVTLIPREVDPFALPSPLDLGAARVPRKVFALLHDELQERGELDEQKLLAFVRLARLEQRAAQQRASAVAGDINPYAIKAVSEMMPRLAELDTEIRDVVNFLDALEETRDCGLFHQQHSVLHDALESDEFARLEQACAEEEMLHPLEGLLKILGANPLEGKALAFYSKRLMEIGEQLFSAGIRPVPIDCLESVLYSYQYAEGAGLRIPVGPSVAAQLDDAKIEGVSIVDGSLIVPFDLHAARRVRAPLGLPFPPSSQEEEPGEEEGDLKKLIMSSINNTSILLGLLRNPKVVNKPGVVCFIANSCRLPAVLEYIATTKRLYSGFANKDVPLAIVRSPARLPVKLVRRFIHVKYIRGVELRRLARDKSGLRREIYKEIQDYLGSLA